MDEIKLAYEPVPSRIDMLARWFPRLAVAIVFVSIGSGKFGSESPWIEMFDRIGWGQWLRYATGGMQIGGALLVLIPRTFRYGIALIALTLAGAIWTWVALVGEPFNAVIPAVVLFILIIVGLQGRH